MNRKIKLIWEFRGPNAEKTAIHHEIHLKEYIQIEQLSLNITGYDVISEFSAIAYMIVYESDMNLVRAALKPHRGQLYENQKA